jgi:predicted Zn-dependent peptidase
MTARTDTPGYKLTASPMATQTQLRLTQRLPYTVAADPLMAQLVVYALRTRLMNNLRTARGWSYEIYPFRVETTRGYAAMRLTIPVQTDKTAEAIKEVIAEIEKLRTEPVTPEFLASIRSYVESNELTAGLGSLERMNAQLLELARNDLPPSYYADAIRRLAAATPADLLAAAKQLLDPASLSWNITGEPTALQRELAELGLNK